MEVLPQEIEISVLKKEIEKSFGLKPEMKNDYIGLSNCINKKLAELFPENNVGRKTVSEHTLMRIWGYVESNISTSNATWILLARSIGYLGWDDFKSKINNTYNPPTPSIEEVFENQREEIRRLQEDMICSKDGIYILGWHPEKYIKLEHIKNYAFKVLECKRMNKKPGEIFDAPDFCLSSNSTSEGSALPDIMIFDNIGYFDFHGKENEDYFYL